MPEVEAVEVLKCYGLPVLDSGLANSENEAADIAEKIGFPVVMKVISDDIVHKFDVGGVVLNVSNKEEAKSAYSEITLSVKDKMPKAKIKGIFITKMILKGEEVILGIKRDPAFDAVVMFGFGGIFVEIFKDVTFRVAPLSDNDALKMIHDIKSAKILTGARGRSVKDINAIQDSLIRIAQLAVDCPQIKELDINPLIVLEEGKGCFVADAKIML